MLDFLIDDKLVKFLVATLFGSLVFFSAVIAPTIFTILNQENSRNLVRAIFPKLYLWGIIISTLFLIQQINNFNLSFFLSLTILLGFIFSRQFLMPKINKISDKKDKVRFKKLHTLSVTIFLLQLIIMLIIIFY